MIRRLAAAVAAASVPLLAQIATPTAARAARRAPTSRR